MSNISGSVVILGGRGMLGSDLSMIFSQCGIQYSVYDRPDFDITKADQVTEAIKDCELIVNCAAYTNVDGAESEKETAWAVNADAVGQLGSIAKEYGKWVLHISTDFVFDGGGDKPYVETDTPKPLNEYGKSKLGGEQQFFESRCDGSVMRVQWTYGSAGNNFVTKLLTRAKETGKLRVVDDQVGSPTATKEVANAICELLEKRPNGLYHFASSGFVSRFEMAEFIINKLNMDIDLQPCKSSDFVTPAARPLNSRFCCDKISAFLDEAIRPWQQPLEEFLNTL